MMKKIWEIVRANDKLIIITLEVFWIVVFLLDRIGSQGAVEGVPAFVYVNF